MHTLSAWPARPLQMAIDDAPPDDASLVHAAAGADPAARAVAFDALYQRYFTRIYAYLRARTANQEDAADLTQQVFLRALDALPRYRLGSVPVSAWLFRIARNAAIDFHRRSRDTLAWDLLPVECPPRAGDTATTAILANEDRAYLRILLEPLSPETREMLALRFSAGLSCGEIAAVLGKGESAVKKRLARAIQTLKERSNAIAR